MNNETSIEEFIDVIEKLPAHEYKEKWKRWLKDYDKPGPFDRQTGMNHSAKYAYNHIAYPEMLLWLIEEAGNEKELVELAKSDCSQIASPNRQSGIIRKRVPWATLEHALWRHA